MIIQCKTLMNFHYWLINEARSQTRMLEESDHGLLSRFLYSGQQSIPAIPGACVKNNEEYRPVLVIDGTELDYLNIIHTYLNAKKQASGEGFSIQDWMWGGRYEVIQFYEPIGFLSFSRGERPAPVDLTAKIHRMEIDYQARELVFNLSLGKS